MKGENKMNEKINTITSILNRKVFLYNSITDTGRLKHEINAIVEILTAIGCRVHMYTDDYGHLRYVAEINGMVSFY